MAVEPPPGAAPDPKPAAVAEQGADLVAATLPAAAVAPAPPAPGAVPAEPTGRPRGRRPAVNPAAAFTAAVDRRQDEIRGCFARHARADGPTAGELSLRFEVGATGRVTSVAVLPASVAGTPLGSCLTEVGTRTVFAPQPAPVAFRIPLTLERRRSAASP